MLWLSEGYVFDRRCRSGKEGSRFWRALKKNRPNGLPGRPIPSQGAGETNLTGCGDMRERMNSGFGRQLLLNVATVQTVEAERDALVHEVGRVEVVREIQHVSAALRTTKGGGVAVDWVADDLCRTLDVLTGWKQDCSGQAENSRMVRGAVVPLDQVRAATDVAVKTTAPREVA